MIPLKGSAAPPLERRTWHRFKPRPENGFILITPAGDKICPGKIHDISVGGVAILLSQRCEPGILLAIDLRNTTVTSPQTLLMRVVRVAERDDGTYLVAGVFTIKMSENSLQALVR